LEFGFWNFLELWVLDFELSIPPSARQYLHQPLALPLPGALAGGEFTFSPFFHCLIIAFA
jgi:hypothetical protein